jgi:Phosphotransferase enzyme family
MLYGGRQYNLSLNGVLRRGSPSERTVYRGHLVNDELNNTALSSGELRTRAVASAVAVAKAYGLRSTAPIILRDRCNVSVHLRPAPVVARVATTTALVRPNVRAWVEREVAVAHFLAERGALVVPPSDLLPPGPHEHDGLVVSFWRFIDHDPGRVPKAHELGQSLAELHAALRHYPGELPYLDPALGETQRVLDYLERVGALAPGDVTLLRHVSERLVAVLHAPPETVQALHGDAHAANVFVTAEGLLWTDFEDTCCGAIAWDLACLTRALPLARSAAFSAYGATPSQKTMQPYLDARTLQVTVWRALNAYRFPQHGDHVEELLHFWRERA